MKELQATKPSYGLRSTAERFFNENIEVIRFIDTEFISRAFTDELLAGAEEHEVLIDLSNAGPVVNQMVSTVLESRRNNGYETDVSIDWSSKMQEERDS